MKKGFKGSVSVTAAAVLMLLSATYTSAAAYKSYNYNSFGEVAETADIYEPSLSLSGEKLGIGAFSAPADIFEKDGSLYILDSGNNRIAVYGKDGRGREITLTNGGNAVDFSKATGLYIDTGGTVYIADSGNGCVWATDGNGAVKAKITKPKSEYFDDALEFLPRRVTGDTVGNIYVQCTGVYEGLLILNSEYEFSGFFGSEKVQTTAELLRNFFWKQLMTAEQREAMANYVPSEIYSMDMSADNFLYTITPGSLIGGKYCKSSPDSIRCLNPKGADILESSMSKDVEKNFENDNRYLNFIDIAYSENGFINVIDNKQGRVYQFDNNMQLVTAFGGIGDYSGTFRQPIAIEACGDDIAVLDSEKNTVTYFSLTETGKTVHKALTLYNAGNYSESLTPWREVIKSNPNFRLAYIGVANALFNDGEYRSAMNYYEQARDTGGYGNAYREYRVIMMRKNFVWILLVTVVLAAAVKIIKTLLAKKGVSVSGKLYSTDFGISLYSAFHPFVGFDRLRSRKITSKSFIFFVYILLVLLGVCEQQYMGKAFAIIDSSRVNILNIALVRAAALILFAAANWAFSELMTGKATFKQICMFTSAALVPYIISGFVRVLLSRFLVQNEAVFMSVVLAIGIICSFAVLMAGFSVFHEFELGKSVFSFIVTLIGIVLIAILAFLFYNLTQNVIDFIKTVFSEMLFRMNA